jgi:hypothetical protein
MKLIFATWLSLLMSTAAQPDLSTVPEDLAIPPLTIVQPGAGNRVSQTTSGWEGTKVHHILYLPTDWQPNQKLPVIVEYAGNGNYKNKYGDISEGIVEGSRLGYGMSAGKGFIWICMPYVQVLEGKSNATVWWGDVEETKRYCLATVRDVCTRFGGDAEKVILCGFSRGSIGCNFIGLHDDEISKLWRGFVCHSHYDGVIEKWPYRGADRASALVRLKRLNGRPQFISHEVSAAATEEYLKATNILGNFTFVPIPYRNHSDAWVLRDIPERRKLREWLTKVIGNP